MQVIDWRRVVIVCCGTVLAASTVMAQQTAATVTETVTMERDLNGRETATKKVVTHFTRTDDEQRIVVETYVPSLYPDCLVIDRRVSRVITVTPDGSRTVEQTEERNPGSPGDALRVVQRSVTTMRRNGSGGYTHESQVFEPGGDGRLVLVRTESEHSDRH